MTTKRPTKATIALIGVVTAVAMALAVAPALVTTPTLAKISDPSCTNGGGNEPGGQQPACKGGGLEQNPAENPAGNAPPGQQP